MNEIMIIVKNGENDYTLWLPDILNDDKILNALFAVHANSGYSVRGTLEEIKEEII